MSWPSGQALAWPARFTALLCLVLLVSAAADDRAGVAELKAAFIYRFTRFITWPDLGSGAAADAPFVIAVMGDSALAEALRALETSGRKVAGHPIRVRVHGRSTRIADAQILFVGAQAASELPEILSRTKGWPLLVIGDTPGLVEHGAAIEFFLKPDIFGESQRLRFRLNPAALRERGLSASAQLYDVAEVVE